MIRKNCKWIGARHVSGFHVNMRYKRRRVQREEFASIRAARYFVARFPIHPIDISTVHFVRVSQSVPSSRYIIDSPLEGWNISEFHLSPRNIGCRNNLQMTEREKERKKSVRHVNIRAMRSKVTRILLLYISIHAISAYAFAYAAHASNLRAVAVTRVILRNAKTDFDGLASYLSRAVS